MAASHKIQLTQRSRFDKGSLHLKKGGSVRYIGKMPYFFMKTYVNTQTKLVIIVEALDDIVERTILGDL